MFSFAPKFSLNATVSLQSWLWKFFACLLVLLRICFTPTCEEKLNKGTLQTFQFDVSPLKDNRINS